MLLPFSTQLKIMRVLAYNILLIKQFSDLKCVFQIKRKLHAWSGEEIKIH